GPAREAPRSQAPPSRGCLPLQISIPSSDLRKSALLLRRWNSALASGEHVPAGGYSAASDARNLDHSSGCLNPSAQSSPMRVDATRVTASSIVLEKRCSFANPSFFLTSPLSFAATPVRLRTKVSKYCFCTNIGIFCASR